MATRLTNIAEFKDLLHEEQIGGKAQKSAIDAAMVLTNEIQYNRIQNGFVTSALFLDIKNAYGRVSEVQFLRVCQKLGLPISLCFWFQSFLNDRTIQLVFDGEIQPKTSVNAGIPQGSPISPMMFLIYIRYIFEELDILNVKIRKPNYVDDMSLITSSKSIKTNCEILKHAAEKLIQAGYQQKVDFDADKTELIHFHTKRHLDEQGISLDFGTEIKEIMPQEKVK